MHAGRHQPSNVSHVDHEQGADLVGDLAKGGEVDDARIGAGAADDHLRAMAARQLPHLVVVDRLAVAAHVIGHHVVEGAGEVDRQAVREVAAVGKLHGQQRVTRLQKGEVHGQVG